LKSYPGHYIHGISLEDRYPCWNLALSGRLWSPDFAALADPGLAAAHQPLRDASIEMLRTSGVPQGVPTPRATWCVWAAAWVRRGGHVGIGTDKTNWLPQEQLDEILRRGDIELAFEARRREVLSDGASRLASLYLAEDSDTGRAHIRQMLGDETFIIRVTVPLAIRVTKADTRWFDLYCQDQNPDYIDKYWSSVACDTNSPTWEYLVDGVVEVDDPEGLAHIRKFGAHRFLGQQDA